MSRFTSAQRAGILAEARANVSRRNLAEDVSTRNATPEIVYKTHLNAAPDKRVAPDERAASGELPWWEWVERCVDARLTAAAEGMGQVLGEFHDEALREIAALKRELATLRDEVAVERGLRALRDEVKEARAQVPKVPAIAAKLEAENARLRRDIEKANGKLSRLRVDQSLADHRLAKLSKETADRATVLETKIETSISSFTMREVHPDARAALRNFATDALKDSRTIFTTVGTA
jgi:hypothetical protein